MADFNNFWHVTLRSFSHLTLMLSLHYRVKCRSHSLAIDNNGFLPGSVCVSSEIINWIATNTLAVIICVTSRHLHYSMCSKCPPAASGRHWHHLPTARSVGLNCMTQAAHSLLMYHFSLSTYNFKIKTKQQIFNDFVVSVIFLSDACTTQYEFIVVSGQTTTLAFHN